MKTLAGSILSRKAKHKCLKQKANARRSPTPTSMVRPTQHLATTSLDFDDDCTIAIVSSPLTAPRPILNSVASEPIIRTFAANADSPTTGGMIDLDAALGPFNTPDHGPEFGYISGGGFPVAKRRMHSSGVTGGFTGPGMHYHRRAESAPEMVAFDLAPFKLHRLGSSSTMADVFEEDEEDEQSGEGRSRKRASNRVRIGRVDDGDMSSQPIGTPPLMEEEPLDALSGTPADEQHQISPDASLDQPCAGAHAEAVAVTVQIADDEDLPRAASVAKSSDSTITPPVTGPLRQDSAAFGPLDLGFPAPVVPYVMADTPSMSSSGFPSPDFPSNSFEVSRSLTAASSFTDDHLPSSLTMGEPGPELRISVDDVPSLTSSNSTMTSAYQHAQGPYAMSGPGSRGRSERTSSISSSAFNPRPDSRRSTRTKRSSLVSLSRLVGSSSGEKSKLSIEEKPQPDAADGVGKDKKGKRLSRLMQFWKPKEGIKGS